MGVQEQHHPGKIGQQRRAWKVGSRVQIFSVGHQKWFEGKIKKIFKEVSRHGTLEEWLDVEYTNVIGSEAWSKEIQRNDPYIRPSWNVGSIVDVYSTTLKDWCEGEIYRTERH